MAHSTYLADKLNDHVLRNTVYTPPSSVYLAIFTSANGLDSNDAPSQDEVSGGAYQRITIDGTSKQFTLSAAKTASNNEDWEFSKATAPWGIVTHSAIMDAVTGGNVLYWDALTTPRDVVVNDILRFLAGELNSIYI